MGSNTGLRGERTASDRLSHDTELILLSLAIVFDYDVGDDTLEPDFFIIKTNRLLCRVRAENE
jgi:hypothetical protein